MNLEPNGAGIVTVGELDKQGFEYRSRENTCQGDQVVSRATLEPGHKLCRMQVLRDGAVIVLVIEAGVNSGLAGRAEDE